MTGDMTDAKFDSQSPDARVGTVLGDRYRLDALIGEGAMGRVYEAEHLMMKKRLAVKILHRELTSVPEVVARFEREAMAAANIDHANVAAATDFGKLPDGAVFLVLEFVQGKSLRDELAAAPFPVERALHIARQIASALSAAHALSIVHRDLKPENVMLVGRDNDPDFVKVLDFGIARVPMGDAAQSSGDPITRSGMVFGTPEYMSPEQALGQPVDGRADLYSLGVILYELLSGVRPFSSQSQVGILGQQLSGPPQKFSERVSGLAVPPRAEQVVQKLLAKDPGQRYQTATDALRELDELLRPLPGKGAQRFTLTSGSPGEAGGQAPPPLGRPPAPGAPVGAPAVPPRVPPVPPPLGVPAPSQRGQTAPSSAWGPPPAPPRSVPRAAPPPPPPAPPPTVPEPVKIAPDEPKLTFLPGDALPAFTFPVVETKAVAQAKAAAAKLQAAAAAASARAEPGAKPTFLPGDPLPAFTLPPGTQTAEQLKSAGLPLPPVVPPPTPVESAQTALAAPGPIATPAAASTGAPAQSLPDRARALFVRLRTHPRTRALIQRSRDLTRRGVDLTQKGYGATCEWVEQRRGKLPAPFQRVLKRVSTRALVLGSTAVLVVAMIAVLVAIGSALMKEKRPTAQAIKAAPAAAPSAQEDQKLRLEVDQAKGKGSTALSTLLERNPNNSVVLVALADAYMKESKPAQAVGMLGKALQADPKLAEDKHLSEILSEAARNKTTSDAAFALLQGPMGLNGAEAMYDIAYNEKLRPMLRTRAEEWLRSADFKKVASPALQIAVELRLTVKCKEKYALLARAQSEGDRRALEYLQVLARPVGCGRRSAQDCFPCLRKDATLKQAIEALKKKESG
jgi:serine/threonine-protein kinase